MNSIPKDDIRNHLCNDCTCERGDYCRPKGLVFDKDNSVVECDNHNNLN
jgi:hypothetical protein